ncbi:MAG: extracellular solute-binding protein [Rhodobacteraceae bacterium]|nr:extracellular solute-binding protein [Paracoccaceae bacterium]
MICLPRPRAFALLSLIGCLALPIGTVQANDTTAETAADTTTAHGISAFGELKYPPDFPHFDYVNPDAPRGGVLSFRGQGASRTFDSLNAYILSGEPAQGLERLSDSLLVRAFDEPDAVYGLIAESVEYPEDRSWAIFNMRPEARFSDGEPITAEDVVWTLTTLRDEGAPLYRIGLRDVETVTALDDHRVRVDFREGTAMRDLIATVGTTAILPKHYYEEVDFTRSTLEPPVGSGAFVVDRVQPGRSIRYCRQPDYWGADLPVNVGMYNFDCVVYEYFLDNNAAFEALKSGTYLFHEEMTSATWASGYNFPALNSGAVQRITIEDARPTGTQGFWLNLRREKLQDPLVREAVSLMFNFEWSNETLFAGLYDRTDSFFENSPMQAEGLPEGAELALLEPLRDQLPEAVFTEPVYSPPVNAAQRTDRRAIRAASALLDEAGWEVGDDGLRRNAAGEVLTLDFVYGSPGFERIILPYIENLKRVGINARSVLIDPAQMQQRQQDFDYDVTVGRFVMGLSPSVELRSIFGSQAADAPGSFNFSGVADPAVDALIEAIISAQSREEMEVAARALDRVLRAQHIWVPNWYKATHWLAFWDVFGRPEEKPPYVRGDDYWWFDQEKQDALVASGALRR